MNKLLAVAIGLLISSQVFAQQKPQYSQYVLNNYLLNPAISGIEDYIDVKMGIRQQWAGLEGAPESYYASIHAPLDKDMTTVYRGNRKGLVAKEVTTKRTNVYRRVRSHHGIGAIAMSTKTGPLKRTSLGASYAFHLPISRTTKISAGVSPGMIQYSLDPSSVRTAQANDPAIMDGRVNEIKFDLNMGLWLYSRNYYVGVAGAQLVPSKRELINLSPADNSGTLQKHYFVTGGFRMDLSPDLAVIPSVMVKMAQPSPVSVDATVKVLYASRIWAAASYRNKESIAAMAGVNISPLLDVAYSYDASTSPLGFSHAGSHEVVVGFKLRNAHKVICPSWAW